MTGTLALQFAVVFSLRLLLFFGCRKYLLRTIYHDLLQDLRSASPQQGKDAASHDVEEESDVELNLLPAPSTSSNPKRGNRSGEFHSSLARSLFSFCFEESCVLFALLMCQGVGLLEPKVRMANWKFSLFTIVLVIVVFIPLSFSLVVTSLQSSSEVTKPRRRSWVVRTLLTVTPVLAYLFLLSYVPLPSALSSTTGTSTIISRLIVIGTVILGSLSGFGSVNNAWHFLPLSSKCRKNATDGDVSSSEQALLRIRSDLAAMRDELRRRESSQPQNDGTWLSKVAVNFRGSTETSSVALELQGLEALEYQMSKNLEALRQRRDEGKFSHTLKGRVFGLFGRLFAVYCVFRIISSAVNIVVPMRSQDTTSTSSDLVTQFLVYCVSLFPSVHMEVDDIASIARQISLALVGVIILSSIRLVLTGVARILRVTNRKLGASIMLLLLAQLMGIYLLSTLVQLRTSFPSSNDEDNLFNTLPEYVVFGGMFDGTFLATVLGTCVVKWFGERITGGEA